MDIFWPDECVHRSGVSDICLDKLTLPEVVCGTLWNIETTDIDQDDRSARNQPMIDLMILAEQFQWDKDALFYVMRCRNDTARASPMVSIHQGLERRDATTHGPVSHTGQSQSSQRVH